MSEPNVPIPINDPIRSYSKGTPDRKKLKAKISELKNQEIEDFNRNERFDKKSPITDWEKNNTLDC